MQDKKQIIGLILSVVLSVGLVVAGANAATTVGNAVSVGSTLAVTATTTLDGDITLGNAAGDNIRITGTPTFTPTTTFSAGISVGGDLTASMDLTVTATTTMNGDIVLGNATADNITTTGIFTTTTWAGGTIIGGDVSGILDLTANGTSTFNGDVTLGDAVGDNIRVNGIISSATTTLLSIGGGPMISKLYSTSTVIDFGAIAALACATSSTSLSGVLVGDPIVLGVPEGVAGATTTISWNAWVSANDTVYVRVCNVGSSGPTPNFPAATFRIDVWQH